MSDPRLQVDVSEWELACCGGPLQSGDVVSWRLLFIEDAAAPEQLWTATPVGDVGPERTARVLDGNGVQVAWTVRGRELPTGIVRLRGRFTATWHGGDWTDDLPPVRGRVERIQLVRELFEETHGAVPDDHSSTWHAAGGGRTFIVVPGAEDLADVEMAPDPTDEPDLDLRSGAYRELTGYRVDLQLLG